MEHHDGSSRHLRVAGELDLITSPILVGTLDKMAAESIDGITIDLTDVSFMDSNGLRAIIDVHSRFSAAGGRLVIGSMSDSARRVLQITGMLEELAPE